MSLVWIETRAKNQWTVMQKMINANKKDNGKYVWELWSSMDEDKHNGKPRYQSDSKVD